MNMKANKILWKKAVLAACLLLSCMGVMGQDTLIIENQNISSGQHDFYTPGKIISPLNESQPVQVSGGASIEYIAGKDIELRPGFRVSNLTSNGKFHAHIIDPVIIGNS